MKKRNQSRVKEKLTTFFTKTRISKRMSRKRVAHSDNIIVSLFTMGCCEVLFLSTFENSFLTMKNSYHKAFVPSRRVNYYKHVEFDLRDNSPQNLVLKTSGNGYLDLRRTRKKRSYYWSMNLTRLSDYLQNPTESQSQSHLDSALKGTIRVYLQLSMNLNDSHFSFPRCPLRAFCGSSSSNNNKNKTPKKTNTHF